MNTQLNSLTMKPALHQASAPVANPRSDLLAAVPSLPPKRRASRRLLQLRAPLPRHAR